MKKIINEPTQVVDEMLEGLSFMHDDLVQRLDGFDVIVRKAEKTGKVGLISGGGSGHEPSHAGFVGDGMLSAAICGAVFTSPTPDQKPLRRLMKVLEFSWSSRTILGTL